MCGQRRTTIAPVDTPGQRISLRLEQLGRKPVWLAAEVDTDQRTVERWISDSSNPRFDYIVPIADALQVSARWLLSGEGNPDDADEAPAGGGPDRRAANGLRRGRVPRRAPDEQTES